MYSFNPCANDPWYIPVQYNMILYYDDVIMRAMAGVSNHQPHDCFFNCLFRRRSKKTPKLRVTGLCAGNSPCLLCVPQRNKTAKYRKGTIFRLYTYYSEITRESCLSSQITRNTAACSIVCYDNIKQNSKANGGFRSEKASNAEWASCQIRKIAGCACTGNAGNVFPATAG